MTVKKSYTVGDTVWIYGVSSNNRKSVKGTVIKSFTIDYEGFNDEPHYLIAIPTEIEYLLEVRTWHTISQDENGHVGSFREVVASNSDATIKIISRTGMHVLSESIEDEDGPSAEQIHAALEKSQKEGTHSPLVLKPANPAKKRRTFSKRKKNEQ
jgi:hypothetical protein